MKKFHVHRGNSCKITAPTDKICGNESKIRTTSQNYRFFQCIFINFLNLSQFSDKAIQNLNVFFSQFDMYFSKCTRLPVVLHNPSCLIISQHSWIVIEFSRKTTIVTDNISRHLYVSFLILYHQDKEVSIYCFVKKLCFIGGHQGHFVH